MLSSLRGPLRRTCAVLLFALAAGSSAAAVAAESDGAAAHRPPHRTLARECSDEPIQPHAHPRQRVHPADSTVSLSIRTSTLVGSVDPRFLSLTVDAAEVANRFDDMPWATPGLREMAGALQPTMVRLGGAAADLLTYQFDGDAAADLPPASGTSPAAGAPPTMLASDFTSFLSFLSAVSWQLIFTLNERTQRQDDERGEGAWNSANAEQLIAFVKASNASASVLGWQLGTAPDLYSPSISPAQLIADTTTLSSLLRPQQILVGWEVAGLQDGAGYFEQLMKQSSDLDLLNATTLQFAYTPLNSSDPLSSMLSPAMLAQLPHFLSEASSLLSPAPSSSSRLPLYLTLSILPSGGVHGISDRFASGFVFLDALGAAAASGLVSVIFRETLRASETTTPMIASGLLTSNILPTPDLFSAVLYKRLMGAGVLAVLGGDPTGTLRVYAGCTQNATAYPSDSLPSSIPAGSVTLLFLNLNTVSSVSLLGLSSLGPQRIEFHLTPSEIGADWRDALRSRHLKLNGQILLSQCNGSLPHMPGRTTDNAQAVTIEPLSYGFLVFPQARAEACGYAGEEEEEQIALD